MSAQWEREAHLRKSVCRFGRLLHGAGLVAGTAGNLSVRIPDGRVLVTPRGSRKDTLEPPDLVLLDVESPDPAAVARATTEWPLHRACHRTGAEVAAVIHGHAPALTALGLRRLDLEDLLPEAARAVGGVGRVPWAPSGSEVLGREVAEAVGRGVGVVLLERHGAAAVGATLQEAFDRMELAELTARAALLGS